VLEGVREFWKEFRRMKSGMFGLVLLIIFVAIVIFEPLLLGYPETNERWNDPTYWQGLPMNAPPVWAARGMPGSETLKVLNFSTEKDGTYFDSLDFSYDFDYDGAPDDLIISLDHAVPYSTYIYVSIRCSGHRSPGVLKNSFNTAPLSGYLLPETMISGIPCGSSILTSSR